MKKSITALYLELLREVETVRNGASRHEEALRRLKEANKPDLKYNPGHTVLPPLDWNYGE